MVHNDLPVYYYGIGNNNKMWTIVCFKLHQVRNQSHNLQEFITKLCLGEKHLGLKNDLIVPSWYNNYVYGAVIEP